MLRRILASLFLFSLFIVAGGGAQSLSDVEKPVWMMESIRVKPGMFGFTLGYLDDNWIRVREEARHQGAVLSYHRFIEQGNSGSDRNIVLITEFKNRSTYYMRDSLFAAIRQRLPNNTAGVVRPQKQEDLYETLSTGEFLDYPDADNVQPRLLSRNQRQALAVSH
jgi:hypothetical protein